MKKRFVIIGSTLSGNKGAAAMLESSMQTLEQKFPGSYFTLLTYLPLKQEQALNTYKNLTILKASPLYLALVINPLALLYRLAPFLRGFIRRNKQIDALASADVLLDQAGVSFIDGREKFLLYNIASTLPALLVQTKIVKCAQALGPFQNPINRFFAKRFLPKMAVIAARGSITYSYLEQLGLENIVQAADYAFLLDVTKQEKKSASNYYDEAFFQGGRVVGIAPSVVMQKSMEREGKDYTEMIKTFVNQIISEGYKVVLVPHSGRKDARVSWVDTIPIVREIRASHSNDLFLCREIFNQVHEKDSCLFIDDELASQELRAVIGKCDFFIASRFHAMISSLAMEVPTLVAGWSHKYKEVLEMFELEKWSFGRETLTDAHLHEQFGKLVKNEKEIRRLLGKHLPEVKQKARLQVEAISEISS